MLTEVCSVCRATQRNSYVAIHLYSSVKPFFDRTSFLVCFLFKPFFGIPVNSLSWKQWHKGAILHVFFYGTLKTLEFSYSANFWKSWCCWVYFNDGTLGIRILSFSTKCWLRYWILMLVGHGDFVYSPEAAYDETRSSPWFCVLWLEG
jgi:hypothetical protein